MNGKYKSLHNEELNRFWNEAGVSELVSLRPIDFVDKMASFLFSPEICEIYLKKRKEAAEDENMHIFVLCALIFRDHPKAEEWLYNFDFSSAEELSLTKNILRNISILDKTTEEIHRLLKNKTQHYSCQYEQEFIDLYERSFKDNKLKIADELGKIGKFDHKNPSARKKYNAIRKSYERWRQNYERMQTNAQWPSKEFIIFLALLSYKFVDCTPMGYILMRTADSDPQLQLIRKYALGAGRIIQDEPSSSLSAKDRNKYRYFKHCPPTSAADQELFEQLKMKLVRKNDKKTIDEYKEEAYIEEHREIYLRGAILGDVQFARKIGWKFCGFEEISLAQEPKYGRITANSAMLFPNGVQVNKGAIFQCIKFSILEDENGKDFLATMGNHAQISDYENTLLFPLQYPVKTVILKINAQRLDEFMTKGIQSVVGDVIELKFYRKKYIPVLPKILPDLEGRLTLPLF